MNLTPSHFQQSTGLKSALVGAALLCAGGVWTGAALGDCPDDRQHARARAGLDQSEYRQPFESGYQVTAYRQRFRNSGSYAKSYAHCAYIYCGSTSSSTTMSWSECAKSISVGNRAPGGGANARPCKSCGGANSTGDAVRDCNNPFALEGEDNRSDAGMSVRTDIVDGVLSLALEADSALAVRAVPRLLAGQQPSATLIVEVVDQATEQVVAEGRIVLSMSFNPALGHNDFRLEKTGLLANAGVTAVPVGFEGVSVDLAPVAEALGGMSVQEQLVGFEVQVTAPIEDDAACSADFDGDGDLGTDADIEAFFACLGGNCCEQCLTADFNNDGDTGTDADIEAFFSVLAGGPC